MTEYSEADIQKGNERARSSHGDFTYWTPEQTQEKLRGAPERLKRHPEVPKRIGVWGAWNSIEVRVDDKWYDLCSTDLMDDIRVFGTMSNSIVVQVCRDATYGARVTDDAICLINFWSDH